MSDDDSFPLIGSEAAHYVTDTAVRGGAVSSRISIDKLRDQIAKMRRVVSGPEFEREAAGPGGFQLDEIKLTAELTASAELGFLVGGAEAEARGAVEITFRRRG
ncbi:MAG: hypothetical protein ACI8U3_001265 [Brevundimonas sp.]|jgi:hypothetical protein|uniref:Pepco domain-containing protein n=1 Tax=Brevundimonas sp. TaxID=1871086 RepID=UPI0039E54B09